MFELQLVEMFTCIWLIRKQRHCMHLLRQVLLLMERIRANMVAEMRMVTLYWKVPQGRRNQHYTSKWETFKPTTPVICCD